MYLIETPIILSGQKYEAEIGSVLATSYQEGIKETLEWMREQNSRVSNEHIVTTR